MAALDAQRSVVDDDCLVLAHSGQLEAPEIGLGMGLAVGDTGGGHAAVFREGAGIVRVEAREHRFLARAGDEHGGEPTLLQAADHLLGSGHHVRPTLLYEVFGFQFVKLHLFFLCGRAAKGAADHEVDDISAGAALIEEKFLGARGDVHFGHDAHPGAGVIGHGVVEHAVHVDECGFYLRHLLDGVLRRSRGRARRRR